MTDTRATHVAAEHWLSTSPQLQVTQVAAEHWATVNSGSVQLAVTSMALEHWASVASVSAVRNGPIITMIG
jgi:hypothetical protein